MFEKYFYHKTIANISQHRQHRWWCTYIPISYLVIFCKALIGKAKGPPVSCCLVCTLSTITIDYQLSLNSRYLPSMSRVMIIIYKYFSGYFLVIYIHSNYYNARPAHRLIQGHSLQCQEFIYLVLHNF